MLYLKLLPQSLENYYLNLLKALLLINTLKINVAISPTETKDDLIILLKSSNKDSPGLLLTKVFLTLFPTIIKIDVLIAINCNSENCLFSTFAPPKYIYNCNETWSNDSICDSHAVTKVTFMCPSAELT